jgi:hypothetical protein
MASVTTVTDTRSLGLSSAATAEPTTPPPMTTMRLVIGFSALSIAASR